MNLSIKTVAVTGGTGFIGRYIIAALLQHGYQVRAWRRAESDLSDFPVGVEWISGELGDAESVKDLVAGVDGVIHSALYRPGIGFRGAEGDLPLFVKRNVLGSIELMDAAKKAGVSSFVFISSCAVHEKILADRPLDEAHPLWANNHYGAYKAAVEKFVHSYGYGSGFNVCALRPTGVYGLAHPAENSKWFELVRSVVKGEEVTCERGGKEVHAADVAKAACLLLTAGGVSGEAYNCYDRYISQFDVAMLAKELSGSSSKIIGEQMRPTNEIETGKLRALGMEFGGAALLSDTIKQLVEAAA